MEAGKVTASLTADASGWLKAFGQADGALQRLTAAAASFKAMTLAAPDVSAALTAIKSVETAYKSLQSVAAAKLPALPAPSAPVARASYASAAPTSYAGVGEALAKVAMQAQKTDLALKTMAAGVDPMAKIEVSAEKARAQVAILAQRTGDAALAEQALSGVEAKRAAQLEKLAASQNAASTSMIAGLQSINGIAGQVGQQLERVSVVAAGIGLGIAAGLGAAVGSGLATAAGMQQIQLGFEAMLGSAEAATGEIAKLNELAAKTPFEFQDLVTGSQSLLAAGQGLGMTADGARALLTAVGDRLALMGKGADKIKLVDLALAQMMMKGKVRAGEMNQLAEAGFDPWQRLSKELGKSMAETNDLVSKGMVPAAKMMQAIVNQPGAALGAMQKQSQTLIGLFSTLKDTVNIGLGAAAKPLVDGLTAAMPSVIAFTGEVVTAIKPIFAVASAAAQGLGYLLAAFNALPSGIRQAALAVAIFGTMAAAALVAATTGFLALIPSVLSAAASFAALDAAALPVIAVLAAIGAALAIWGATVAVVAAEWAAGLALIGAAVGALYVLWESDFLGMATVVRTLAALIGSLLSDAFTRASYEARWVFARFLEAGRVAAQFVLSTFFPVLNAFAIAVVKIGETIYQSMSAAFDKGGILGIFDTISHGFAAMVNGILGDLESMLAAAQPALDAMGKGGMGWAARGAVAGAQVRVQASAGSLATSAGQAVASGGMDLAERFTAFLDGLVPKDFAGKVEDYKNALSGLTDALDDAGKKSGGAMRSHAKAANDAAKALLAGMPKPGASQAVNFGLFDMTGLEGPVRTAVEKVTGPLSALYDTFQEMTQTGTMTADSLAFFQGKVDDARKAVDDYTKEQAEAAKEAARAAAEARKAMQTFMSGLLTQVTGSFGKMGELVNAAMEGGKAAGVGGAIAAVMVKLLTFNEKLQALVPALDAFVVQIASVFDGLINGLAPLLFSVLGVVSSAIMPLAPIFAALGNILGGLAPVLSVVSSMFLIVSTFFQIFATMMQAVSPVLYLAFDVIYEVFRVIAVIIMGVAFELQKAWNWIVEAVAGILEDLGLDSAAKALRKQEFDTDATKKSLDALINTSYDAAVANAYNAAATTQAAQAANALTTSLTNVPQGFKLNRYIYQSVNPVDHIPHLASGGLVTRPTVALIGEAGPELVLPLSGGGRGTNRPPPLPSGAGSAGSPIVIESLMVVTDDPRALFDKIQAYADEKAYLTRGSPITLPSRYATG